MTVEKRLKYHQEADRLKALHKIQHPEYKYSPKTPKQVRTSLRTSLSFFIILFFLQILLEHQATPLSEPQAGVSPSSDQGDSSDLEIIQIKPAPASVQPTMQIQVRAHVIRHLYTQLIFIC